MSRFFQRPLSTRARRSRILLVPNFLLVTTSRREHTTHRIYDWHLHIYTPPTSTMTMKTLAFAISCYVVTAVSQPIADESHLIRVLSVKQISSDKSVSHQADTAGRQLQADISCSFTPHGQAISCVEQTPNNDNIKYSVTCPEGVTIVDECLQDQKRICYQFNSLPCIGGFYCGTTNRFALDCGNLFARSNNNTCSKTDCDVNCAQLRDVPVNYNSVPLDNDCFRLGLVRFNIFLDCKPMFI